MSSETIVGDFDKFKDPQARSLARRQGDSVDQLALQGAEKTLRHGIVITMAFSAHTLRHFMF